MSEAELSLQVTPATSTSAQAPVGLTRAEAARRLTQFGLNEIRREAATTPWLLLAGQFKSPVIWLLVAACTLY